MSSLPRRALVPTLVAALSLVALGCGDEDSPSATPEPAPDATATPVVVEEAPESPGDPTVEPSETAPEAPTATPLPDEVRYLPELVLHDAASGPRPLLSWIAVDGAERYTLVVLGADATPYWAWSGAETATHMGGFDDPDAVGPWVHEPMTWTVAATGTDGTPIAISEPGVLTP